MKLFWLLIVLGLVLSSCDPEPVINSGVAPLVPEWYEEEDFSKQFIYNDAGQLIQIKLISQLPNGGAMESQQNFFYHPDGQLKELITDTGWRMVYTFENNRIIRTDEYVNSSEISQYHTFGYDANGLLAESITWQNIPEEGGEIPVSKDTYAYDAHGNMVTQQLYYFTTGGAEAKLQTVFTFSHYDNKINSEDYFDVILINPLVRLRKNNAGKMEVRNGNGILWSTEQYTYEYHVKGYATKKITDVTLYNGTKGSYESTFKFKE